MTTALDRHMENAEFRRLYAEEGFVNESLERVTQWMEENNINRAELARRLGTSRANVTQMLNGRNVSLRTLAAAVHVMGGKPRLEIEPTEAKSLEQSRYIRSHWGAGPTGWARPPGANVGGSPYQYVNEPVQPRVCAGV